VVCKCGKMKFCITEGEETKRPCPICGRCYIGVYNYKTLSIDAVEINKGRKQRYYI